MKNRSTMIILSVKNCG